METQYVFFETEYMDIGIATVLIFRAQVVLLRAGQEAMRTYDTHVDMRGFFCHT